MQITSGEVVEKKIDVLRVLETAPESRTPLGVGDVEQSLKLFEGEFHLMFEFWNNLHGESPLRDDVVNQEDCAELASPKAPDNDKIVSSKEPATHRSCTRQLRGATVVHCGTNGDGCGERRRGHHEEKRGKVDEVGRGMMEGI